MRNRFLKFPVVSVLIPAFNEEKYILQTLNALIVQDYPHFEIIIANNASTDLTAIIVQEFINRHSTAGRHIHLVHENRQGTNFARECARLKASGSVIAQLDADCIPPSNWLSKGISLLCMNNKKRVAVTGPYDYFDGNKWMRFSTLFSQMAVYPLINSLVQVTGKAAILIGGNTFIRSDVLSHAGGYNTTLTFYGDDVDMGKKLAKYGPVDFMPSLIQRSSSRRYKANGFWEVNKKYQSCFWKLVWNKDHLLQTIENSHPR